MTDPTPEELFRVSVDGLEQTLKLAYPADAGLLTDLFLMLRTRHNVMSPEERLALAGTFLTIGKLWGDGLTDAEALAMFAASRDEVLAGLRAAAGLPPA